MLSAVCIISGAIFGQIFLEQRDPYGPIDIRGEITGLEPGYHGFHVHQFGDLGDGCKAAGPHFNPFNLPHASPDDRKRHTGDLGNIEADGNGRALLAITDHQVKLFGDNTVIGRAIVVHEKPDDLGRGGNEESKKTGNAGARLGCCVIGLRQLQEPEPAPSKGRFPSKSGYFPGFSF